MKRVLLTGATGFIGAAVARKLVSEGCCVAALIRPNSSPWRLGPAFERIHVIAGAFESPETYEKQLIEFAPDTVMHLAWSGVSKAKRNDSDQVRVNVCGSVDLFLTAVRAGCTTFVGAGSQAEYGPSEEPLHEESPTKPVTLYGAAKLASHTLLSQLAMHHKTRFSWLRLFSVYGPQDDSTTLVSYVIAEFLAGRRPRVSKGDHLWDYLYVDDAAAAFLAVALSDECGVFNVGSGASGPLREIIMRLRDKIDPEQIIGFGEVPEPPGGIRPLRPIVSRLQRLGWRASTTMEDGLDWTIASFRLAHTGASELSRQGGPGLPSTARQGNK